MNFVIIHFNTPELTACLCSSIRKQYEDANIIIFDNSTKRPFENKDVLCNEYIDNTKNQYIDFDEEFKNCPIEEEVEKLNHCGSARHCRTVQWLFDNLKVNDFVLLDSDVLLTRKLDFLDDNFLCAATYEVFPGMKNRFLPFVTYFNLKKIRENNVHYFDEKRMNGLSKQGRQYDTGASFLEDIVKKKLPFRNIDYRKYLVHFRNGSWGNKSYKLWLAQYKKYWL
jgi:hypothetical protein